jgi:hypothetical protein
MVSTQVEDEETIPPLPPANRARRHSDRLGNRRRFQMQAALHDHSRRRIALSPIPFFKGTGWGLLGGLIATLVMDLVLMGILVAAGLEALSCFSIVGDTVARLLSLNGLAIAGSIPLGIAAHYLIGPLMGAVFGAAAAKIITVAKANALRVGSRKKAIVWAVLYAEILSQPMLAMPPILLRMTGFEMLQWFGGSMVMHLVWGCVLGIVWSRGMQLQVSEATFLVKGR